MLLNVSQDPMGTAIQDYFEKGKAQKLKVRSSMFDEDVLPVPHLFRSLPEMNGLEQTALENCSGRVLDVGAGAGCHSLVLQSKGLQVKAIDISALAVDTMQRRGIQDAEVADFFSARFPHRFDTVLMLMNGIGIVGKLDRLPLFFRRLEEILAPGGCVLADSSDLRYIFESEDGTFDPYEFDSYYGEVDYWMQYGKVKGKRFDWLYVDFDRLKQAAQQAGFQVDLLRKGEHYDYLAKLTKRE